MAAINMAEKLFVIELSQGDSVGSITIPMVDGVLKMDAFRAHNIEAGTEITGLFRTTTIRIFLAHAPAPQKQPHSESRDSGGI